MKPLGDFSWMMAVHSVPSSALMLLAGILQGHAAYKTTSAIYIVKCSHAEQLEENQAQQANGGSPGK